MAGLQLKKLKYGPPGLVLGEQSIELEMGKLYALTGRNGSGKSSLLRTIAGLYPSHGGELSLFGENLLKKKPIEIARHIGLVLTKRPDVKGIDVFTLLEMGRFPHQKVNRKEEEERIITWASRLQIEQHLQTPIDHLSDGEFQRVMIARVLIQETPVILLDEPTAFLDFIAKEEILCLLKQLAQATPKIVLFSSHDLALVDQYADQEIRLLDRNEPTSC